MGKKSVSVVLLVMHCLISDCLAMSFSKFTDEAALMEFKAHVLHDTKHILAKNWSQGTPLCSWVGVSCGHRHQRVTDLRLPHMGLRGTISKSIGNLSFLIFLDLGNNSFHGHVPHELGRLRRLKSLLLPFNELSGEIPTSIGLLTELQDMDLSHNRFNGSLPQEMGHLPNLFCLDTSENNISGAIPSPIFNISSLQTIDLTNNMLTGTLPEDMCNNLPNLEELYLSSNQIDGHLPDSLPRCTHLQYISLSVNVFTGSIPRGIGNLSQLEGLYLGHNSLTGSIPSEMGNLAMLVWLYLSRNNLTGSIPPSIANVSKLQVIAMSENNIHGNIPVELGQLLNLQGLYMHSNNLTGEMPRPIFNLSELHFLAAVNNYLSGDLPSAIWLPNLDGFYLGGNAFTGTIPSSISNSSQVSEIDLSHNYIKGEVPRSLGSLGLLQFLNLGSNQLINNPHASELGFIASLTNCRHLSTLLVGGNPLNGTLPKSLGNLSNSLQIFSVSDCRIKGMIPSEIGNLTNLVQLYMADNDLMGSLPATLGQLRKIQGLEVAGTLIQGSIPINLCNLKALAQLSLSGNKLSGPIPWCLGELRSIQILYLDSNSFSSKIPSSIWSLEDVNILDLSSNALSGSLPPEIGNLKHIVELKLSANQLTGEIPSTVGQLQSLESLDLSKNGLSGSIPPSSSNLLNLKALNLSQNDLSGSIPKSLQKLADLKFFNVSFNRLSGEIPRGGPFANLTAESFLHNDALCGPPQFHVKVCNGHRQRHMGGTKIALRYIVPAIAFVAIAATFVIWMLASKDRSITPPVQVDPPSRIAHRRISYQEILSATNSFGEDNLIGVGSLGSVFKAMFSDSMVAAVKVFDLELQSAFKSFEVECEVLRNLRHRNLVKVISSCSTPDFRALVLEYMPNGSLERWLHTRNYFLNIVQRLDIMIDVASALEYLHHGYSNPVVHCDLKPSNILLDEDMVAHVGDFGIAKLLTDNKSSTRTRTLGTIGYMAPEYGIAGIVSAMGDVYSYGILLMEICTRKKPTDEQFTGELSLKHWVFESVPGGIMEIVDSDLLREERVSFTVVKNCLSSLLQLALQCTVDSPEERINMRDVLAQLKKIRGMFC